MMLKILNFNFYQSIRGLSKLSYINKLGTQPLLSTTGGQLVEQAAKQYPDRPAIISCHQNKQLTFSELLTEVDKFGAGLRKLDIHQGDCLAIWSPSAIEWIVTSLACARLGVTLVQLNHSYKQNELVYSINKTKAKALVCGHVTPRQDYYEIIKSLDSAIFENGTDIRCGVMPSLRSVIMMDDNRMGTLYFHDLTKGHSEEDFELIRKTLEDVQIDDPCNIQFTSGSTGVAKAAILTHHNVVNNSFNIGNRLELFKKHYKICVQVPLFHTFGTTAGIYPSLHFGATLVLPTDFYNPKLALQAINDHKCTVVYGTPTMHTDLVEQQKQQKLDIKSEIATTGGAPTSPQLIFDMYKHLGYHSVVNIFGLTETTAVCFQSYLHAETEHVANSVGHIGDHCEVKVIDESGKIVPFGQPGEFCVRGYMAMLGYLEEPVKTAEMIGPDRWVKSGDKFILYEDGTGKIVGRIKDIINRGGENIHPKEIEDCLTSHPKLIDCQVVGLPHKRLGEEVCACLRLKSTEKEITLQEVVDYCKEHMAHYKIPSKIHILTEYPKTTSGKIQKFKIVEMLKKHYNFLQVTA